MLSIDYDDLPPGFLGESQWSTLETAVASYNSRRLEHMRKYMKEYRARVKSDPVKREAHKAYMREYMRDYMRRRAAAKRQSTSASSRA